MDTEIPSPTAGHRSVHQVAEDETVEVGAELATIDDGGSAGGTPTPVVAEQMAEEPVAEQTGQTEPARAAGGGRTARRCTRRRIASRPGGTRNTCEPERRGQRDGDVAYVTPLVRKLAAERGSISELSPGPASVVGPQAGCPRGHIR